MSSSKPSLEQRAAELASELIFGKADEKPGPALEATHGRVTAAILAFAQSVAAEAAPRWIPVGERLPEHRQVVLFFDRDGHTACASWNEVRKGFEYPFSSQWMHVRYVTHWQPLPAAPEGKS